MADENEHVKNLEKALGSLIDRRRQIAIGLSEPTACAELVVAMEVRT